MVDMAQTAPQRLKPQSFNGACNGTAEAVPFQTHHSHPGEAHA
jgi:hypothetical protein